MTDEMRANPKLQEEYENTFDSEEKISDSLKLTKNNFTVEMGVVDFESLLVPDPLKKGRKETYLGLATSIGEMGIISPIHVMITEGYSQAVENGVEDYEGPKYVLLDGFRRVWGGYKNGLDRCNAVIWDFKDKDKGVDLSTVLAMVLNKTQRRSWAEVWYLYQILEVQSSMSPGTLEYLLQMDPGDAMRLKDIMTCEYPDVKEELLTNKKDINQAYNMLQKYRKEEDKLLKEDNQGISDLEQADGVVEESKDDKLSNEEVKEILEMDEDFEITEDNFGELVAEDTPEVQEVGDRHPLDPALRAEVLVRDNYTCQCCGVGVDVLPMRYAMALLQVHHKVSVANGGPDEKENLVSLCCACHTLVHAIIWSNMRFGMKEEEFDELPEAEKTRILKILKIADKDYKAAKKLGKTKEQIQKEVKINQYKMPGIDMRQNMSAVKEYNKSHSSEDALVEEVDVC